MMGYPGSKNVQGLYHRIISLMPVHNYYYELFLGTGIIMKKKKPALKLNIGCDLKSDCISGAREYFKKHYHGSNGNFQFIEHDTLDYFDITRFKPLTMIYLDPPYMMSSRKQKRRLYEYEFNDGHHRLLLNRITHRMKDPDVYIMISGYHCKLYDETLENWKLYKIPAMTHGGLALECVWCNYDPDQYLKHDYTYAGNDYIDRQRIKRKYVSLRRKLDNLPDYERQMILSNLINDFSEIGSLVR